MIQPIYFIGSKASRISRNGDYEIFETIVQVGKPPEIVYAYPVNMPLLATIEALQIFLWQWIIKIIIDN